MDGRVTGGAVVIDTEVQHISFSQKEYNVVENTPSGRYTVALVRDALFAATEVTVRVATTDLTAIGALSFAALTAIRATAPLSALRALRRAPCSPYALV